MWRISEQELVRYIDQTNLKPEATENDMAQFIKEARAYGFRVVAIMPLWIPLAVQILDGSSTTVVAPIGYPLGTTPSELKVVETEWAIENGPGDIEIDVVMNVSMVKSGQYDLAEDDIRAVVMAAGDHVVKGIIEAPILSKEEIIIASMICERAGAQFIKTSTGFKHFRGWRPSTVDDVKLIKSVVGDRVKIKVAGGISTLDQALAVIRAGASRFGTSSGVHIVETYRKFGGTA